MSFLSPKVPKVEKTPMPQQAIPPHSVARQGAMTPGLGGFTSMVSTSSQGLTRKASTRKNSLLGSSNAS